MNNLLHSLTQHVFASHSLLTFRAMPIFDRSFSGRYPIVELRPFSPALHAHDTLPLQPCRSLLFCHTRENGVYSE